jgi:hypothetical protein
MSEERLDTQSDSIICFSPVVQTRVKPHDWSFCVPRYAKLPVVYKPQRVGMVVHWHPSGLVKAITLLHTPRDDFFLENTDDKGMYPTYTVSR